jgi:hypothetical protein
MQDGVASVAPVGTVSVCAPGVVKALITEEKRTAENPAVTEILTELN